MELLTQATEPVPDWPPAGVCLVRSGGRLLHRLAAWGGIPAERIRVVESPSQCRQILRQYPGSVLLWEVAREELAAAALECRELCRRFPQLRVVMLVQQHLPPAWESTLRLAGACWVHRQGVALAPVVEIAQAHLHSVPSPLSWPWNAVNEELARGNLPKG